jgi:cytochrome c oxidase subunit 2
MRWPASIFQPLSTPADLIYGYSIYVLAVTGLIFALVAGLLAFAIVRYRVRGQEPRSEPAQVFGSTQLELAWTVIPLLIVVTLSLTTTRVLRAIQDAPQPPGALRVVVVGHQWWWEFRYPDLGIVTANELHVPASSVDGRSPTVLTLLSADVAHSFWVPRLAGKTDLIPNQVNSTWIEPREPGTYVGQCAEYCSVQHAKMLLSVKVHSRPEFDRWVQEQQRAPEGVSKGRQILEATACVNCHRVAGTSAYGRFGPDLTHLMSRTTIAGGSVPNTPANLRRWIANPDALKPGALMPSMNLTPAQLDAVTAYLLTLE